MSIIDDLNELAISFESSANQFMIYRQLTNIWKHLQEFSNSDKYIHKGKVFIGIAATKKDYTKEQILETFNDCQLGMIYEKDAILFSRAMQRDSKSNIFKYYTRYVVDGYTEEAILLNKIMEDFPNERCKWKFINGTRYRNSSVLIMPESLRDLHIRKVRWETLK